MGTARRHSVRMFLPYGSGRSVFTFKVCVISSLWRFGWLFLIVAFALLARASWAADNGASVGTPVAVLGVLLNSKGITPNLTVTAYCDGGTQTTLKLDVPPIIGDQPRIRVGSDGTAYSLQYFYLYGTYPESTCTLKYIAGTASFFTVPHVLIGGDETTDIVVTMAGDKPSVQTSRKPRLFEPYIGANATNPSGASTGTGSFEIRSPTPNPCFALQPLHGFSTCMANTEPQFLAGLFNGAMNGQCKQNLALAQGNVNEACKNGDSAICLRAKVRLTEVQTQCGAVASVDPKKFFATGVLWFQHPPYNPDNFSLIYGGVDPDQHATLAVCSVWLSDQHRQIIGKLLKGRCNYGWNKSGFEADQYAFAVKVNSMGQWAPPYSYLDHLSNILSGPGEVVTGPSTVEVQTADHPFPCQGDFRREEPPLTILGIPVLGHPVIDHGMHIGEVFTNGCGFEWGGFQAVGDGVQVYYIGQAPPPPGGHPNGGNHQPPAAVKNCSIPPHLMACGTLLAPQQYLGKSTSCPAGTHGVCIYETCTSQRFTFPMAYCAPGP